MIVLSTVFKVALALLVLALLFQLIGFAAPYWNSDYYQHYGLWQSCPYDQCREYSANSAIGAVRAFETIAFILLVVILLLILYYICRSPEYHILLGSAIGLFVTAVLIIIGILIWVIEGHKHRLSWAFFFCVIAAILSVIVGVLLLLERRSRIIVVGGSSSGAVRTTKTTTTTVTVTRR